jgi:heavy metal sensor kinase
MPIIHILQRRIYITIIIVPIFMLLTSFVARFLATRILGPVEEITKTANKITHEDLSARVEVKYVDEEMKYLVNAFNDMISRLEKSFEYIEEFSSYVAHELKTPLAIIRGESEVALSKEQNNEEYKKVIKVNLEETERIIKTIEDLLLLAKLDYRPEIFKFEKIDIILFFEEIYEQSKILAIQKNISVDINMPEEGIYIRADKLHLRRLFFNLIHNAIKFNSDNGRIDIDLKVKNRNILVSISDSGSGIADEDLPKIFNKYFHKSCANQDTDSGSGLGLTIAQSIAKIHSGKIEVETHLREGVTFNVTLPII